MIGTVVESCSAAFLAWRVSPSMGIYLLYTGIKVFVVFAAVDVKTFKVGGRGFVYG